MGSRAARTAITALLMVGTALMLALNLPGQLSYDSVSQLYQGRLGVYNSWHPPVMAFLLGLFDRLWPGTALFVLFDTALLLGAWLTLLRLGRRPGWDGLAVAAVMLLTPQFLLHQGTVWKDVLFTDSAIAAFAVLALGLTEIGKSRFHGLLALSALLLALASLTRQNGIVLLPAAALALAAGMAKTAGWRRGAAYGAGLTVAALAVIALGTVTLTIRGDGGAGARSEIHRAQLFDLAGAVSHAPDLELPALQSDFPRLDASLRQAASRYYQPWLNDTLEQSADLMAADTPAADQAIFADWTRLVTRHPALYAATRWPVFWWTVGTPDVSRCHPAFVGIEGEPEQLFALGLHARIRPRDLMLANYTRAFMGTPVLSHPLYLALAVLFLVLLLRRRQPADIAMAGLLVGALLFTASFFVISVACDYRYLEFVDLAALSAAFYWCVTRQPREKP